VSFSVVKLKKIEAKLTTSLRKFAFYISLLSRIGATNWANIVALFFMHCKIYLFEEKCAH
jgi:hypothetical protein